IFSLHRSPDLSFDRAHVSHEQFIFCWPLPHVAGSPDRGVLSASLTSTRPSDLPRLASLSGPTGFRLNLMDLPCSHEILGCMPAVRTPEASRTLTASCPGILPSPLRDKVGAFHHDRFRGYVSVHFRSGLHPPCLRFAVAVAGHHARLGTRLLVRLCRGRHHRRLNSMRLQGAPPTPPAIRVRPTRVRWIKRPPAFPWKAVPDDGSERW